MQTFFYPSSDLDDVRELLNVLGSFWENTYDAKDQLHAFTKAIAAGVAQTQLNLLETVASLSRFEVPIFHTENWYPIVLRKSELNKTPVNTYKFDEPGLVFDGAGMGSFDATTARNVFAFPVAENLVRTCQLFDRILFPTIGLVQDIDFIIQESSLVFVQNPFDLAQFPKKLIYKDGAIVDEEIVVWAFKAQLDYGTLFSQFAYALNIKVKSSENAKAFVNAIISGLLEGSATITVLDQALSALFDIPITRESEETVEVVTLDNNGLIIATDKHVYRFLPSATPVVTVGQVLQKNAPLVAGFEVVELNRGIVPDSIKALALDNGFTAACFYGDLVFENHDVPLEVNENHPSGYTFVKFPLAGMPQDVRHFFDELHARGLENLPDPNQPVCAGQPPRQGTLAHILSRRASNMGEPTAADLPATINPLKFIVENVLRNNAFIVTARVSALGKNHLGLYNIRHIRQLLPPYMALLISYTLDGQIDAISPEEAIREVLQPFQGAEPLDDQVAEILVQDRGVTVKTISGTCQ